MTAISSPLFQVPTIPRIAAAAARERLAGAYSDTFHAVEIKSGETIASDFFAGLDHCRAKLSRQTITPWLIHGGTSLQDREKATVLP
jgi:hypothetical protein